jgi:hypothetical protein
LFTGAGALFTGAGALFTWAGALFTGAGALFTGTVVFPVSLSDENKFVREVVNFLCHGKPSSVLSAAGELNKLSKNPPDFLRELRRVLGLDLDLDFMILVRIYYIKI